MKPKTKSLYEIVNGICEAYITDAECRKLASEFRRRKRKKTRIVWQSAEVAKTWHKYSELLCKFWDGSFDTVTHYQAKENGYFDFPGAKFFRIFTPRKFPTKRRK